MFKKLLIANRGEIACRVMRTAKTMGIATVAVHSEADKDAPHVEMADEAVSIGPPKSAESYLVIDRILQACRDTGAEAVHPGYGFLSENAAFVEALDQAGLTFIGPRPKAIRAMGDKIESKKLAGAAKVNVIPGHPDAIAEEGEAVGIAKAIGYPVMLKASAGGGGKGMRIARTDQEVADGLAAARREAAASFGDDRVFIEKFIENPRHIEIQILADGKGNTLYLNERECSIQRRHQKVIEEAPSPFLDESLRKAMGAQAVALAEAVDYVSAGTIEFIVDSHRNFYFLEMNTRLQVEHPVTEMITGLDLVEWMIRIADGEALPFGQDDIPLNGWAMESRVYAEDPIRGFLPSTGRLIRFKAPPESRNVRVDTGVGEGGEVSIYYDPMIAKLITHGADRNDAIEAMGRALDRFFIRGIAHNIGFLSALVKHPRFRKGDLTTHFIAEEYPDGFDHSDVPHDNPLHLAAVAAVVQGLTAQRARNIEGRCSPLPSSIAGDWVVIMDDERFPVWIAGGADGPNSADGPNGPNSPNSPNRMPEGMPETWDVRVDGTHLSVATGWRLGEPLFHCTIDGRPLCIQVERHKVGYRLSHAGNVVDALVVTPRVAELMVHMPVKEAEDTSRFLRSPMPGLLQMLSVQVGQEVKTGYDLCVIEAMKTEITLRADGDAIIEAIHAKEGDTLLLDQPIIEFKREAIE